MYVYLTCVFIYICISLGNLQQTFKMPILLLTHLTFKATRTQTPKYTHLHAHTYITHHVQIYLAPVTAHKFLSRIHWV